MALKKELKKRVNKARLLGTVLKDSLVLNIKRRSRKKRFFSSELKAIIVDMDGTVFRSDTGLEALNLKFPRKMEGNVSEGDFIYRRLIRMVIDGECSVDEAIVLGTGILSTRGLCKNDFRRVLEEVKSKIRQDLLSALKEVKEKKNPLFILATLSSEEFGHMLNEYLHSEFGFRFDGIVGTRFKFNESGRVEGVSRAIGEKDHEIKGIPVQSKFSAIRQLFEEKGWVFSPANMVLLTDGYGDMALIKQVTAILVTQPEPDFVQKMSRRLRLADFIVEDDARMADGLKSILLHEENLTHPGDGPEASQAVL
ncbi:MAG: hypothetical protein HY917_01690 [Candidatus Diapherotrites archaeon]|nr:hypothetical protein [Candidatus Diapherotrites archaeon]